MSRNAKPPATDLMRFVAAALEADTPSDLAEKLYSDGKGVLTYKQSLNVARWWNGRVHPGGEITIQMLLFSGLLKWPGETGAAESPRKELEAARDLLPAKPRSSRATRRAAGQ